ncbi:MAG TPA: MFS transporter [Gemmataceae bacterium]|jgi:predicted MFS family arabinose efflux permease|nr:MFS transporter [Gemmataceae bacterium]
MSSDPVEPSFSRGRERLILLVLAAVQFTSIVDFVVVMPLGPVLERELGLTPARFGLIVSSYTYAAGCAGLLASVILDRFARRTAFLTLYAGFLTGTLACGLAPTYEWLLAARVLTGAFGGVLGGMAMAIVGDVFHEKRRGTATGTLMSAFALASVVGVPAGLTLGQRFGWHVPFLTLAILGIPIFFVAANALPRLDAHLGAKREHEHSFAQLRATFTEPNHLRAFALTVSLMFGAFTVIPFLSPYLVSNVKIPENRLAVVYIAGGVLTLIGAPIAGRLADRFGKLLVYRSAAPLLALGILVATNLPRVTLPLATLVMALVMLCNASRMVPAMAMITSSVAPHRRGGFLGANSAVQHVSAGLGAFVGGFILTKAPDGTIERYPLVGFLGIAATLLSLWLAGRIRIVDTHHATGTPESLAAAAQGNLDADEPITAAEI